MGARQRHSERLHGLGSAMLAIAPAIRQHQFVQKARDWIELRLAAAEPLSKSEEARLAGWVRTKLGAPFEVAFAYLDELPRTAAGKFEEFICEIGGNRPE